MIESFPCTLLLMLNNEATAGGKSIKWLPGGGGFEIIDQNALEKDILPKYFPSSCMFQSFVRRLYRWGFLQIGKRKPGHYIFANEVRSQHSFGFTLNRATRVSMYAGVLICFHDGFHRDNELYKQLKAKPRPKGNNQSKSTTAAPQEGSR
ncbi:hypothetical protein HJC23_007786 [Cyclotella cryptica]|uniref:HSF-type DNA-binding domain-containing protein n=1 Tax=Cyclotella cryptica TaxID=29204 RepID=A0ABD3QZM8_9STRA